MPARRKSSRSRKPTIRSTSEPSYDTKIIVVVLLLVFVYPLGLILMWMWMKSWPVWLKLIISTPFIIGVIFFFFLLTVVGRIMHNGNLEPRVYYQYQGGSYNAPMMRNY